MKPVSHPSNTRTLAAPAGWDQNGLPVDPLGITDQVVEGVPCVWSFWEPDALELAAIAAGSKVILSIVGRTMPPALLLVEAFPAPPAIEKVPTRSVWRDMATAPKDGTLLRLLVNFEDHATDDGEGPQPTIGSNTYDNHHDFDEWQFAGWNWEQDCYTQGTGTPVGWLPLLDGNDVTLTRDQVEDLRAIIHDQKQPPGNRLEMLSARLYLALAGKGWDAPKALSQAALDVIAERQRQMHVEGWSTEHDDEHADDSLATAAACYALPDDHRNVVDRKDPRDVGRSAGESTIVLDSVSCPCMWPWHGDAWKPKDRRSDLVRAAALLLAEIERLDRAAAAPAVS